MVSTIKQLIDVLNELPEDCNIFMSHEEEVIPGSIEVKALMKKGESKPLGVILSTGMDDEMQRLINNN